MSRYSFLAVEALTGDVIDEVPFSTFQWDETLNRPGGWSATISVDHPSASPATLDPWRTIIYVIRDDRILFGGVLITPEGDASSGSLTVSGQGLLTYYSRRHILGSHGMAFHTATWSGEVRFDAVDQFRIVTDLLAHAHSFTGGNPFGLTVTMRGPGGGGISGVARSRSYYAHERKPILEAIEQLSEVSRGFDFSIAYAWNDDGVPSAELVLWYPRRGRSLDLVFEQPKNVTLLSWAADGDPLANVVDALGAGDGDAMLTATSSDINQIYPTGSYPRLERVVSYRDVSHSSTLQAHADAHRLEGQRPLRTARVGIVDSTDVPLGSFGPGDDLFLVARRGYVDVASRYRIDGVSVAINENGAENISVDLVEATTSLAGVSS